MCTVVLVDSGNIGAFPGSHPPAAAPGQPTGFSRDPVNREHSSPRAQDVTDVVVRRTGGFHLRLGRMTGRRPPPDSWVVATDEGKGPS
jgi:hypothetical protein